jgi:hypothetical protein
MPGGFVPPGLSTFRAARGGRSRIGKGNRMTPRQIKLANVEAALTRWVIYTDRAEARGDVNRAAYGRLRVSNARKRLAALRHP